MGAPSTPSGATKNILIQPQSFQGNNLYNRSYKHKLFYFNKYVGRTKRFV